MRLLRDKWAFITGSSRGIGQQVAWGLAARGCNVIVHGRDAAHAQSTVAGLRERGVQQHVVAGELDSAAGVQSVIAAVQALRVPVDILYNNAAIQSQWKPVWDFGADEWQRSFQVNLFAMVALCTAFAPAMRERGFGRIVNLTSGIKDTPNLTPYSVTKAAVDKYSRDLAAELRGSNVLVNYLDPGWLRTDLGGPNADHPVEAVLPGALVPALLDDHGPSGQFFSAQLLRDATV